MKTVWCAEIASKAYIDTVRTVKTGGFQDSEGAELVSAMAGGSNARLIVEAWTLGSDVATSIGLAIASRHTGGRHVCVVPDEQSRLEYEDATSQAGVSPEFVVGEAEEAMEGLPGVDFVVIDCRRRDLARVLRFAKMSSKGAVLVCKNASPKAVPGFRWRGMLGSGTRAVRSTFLPVGNGMEIAQLGTGGGLGNKSRWINHIDRNTGEVHVFLR
ncbi:uncharacterized protein LOC131249518 [Magnolia sinica]|uniref:uncharacterized protein LOC131249518 n=1 Tax=Magnolia sinica TaxID=86752 RepID=UPI002659575B|nr:uncharacterized protein LOC131249518 [Magnolia sinica]